MTRLPVRRNAGARIVEGAVRGDTVQTKSGPDRYRGRLSIPNDAALSLLLRRGSRCRRRGAHRAGWRVGAGRCRPCFLIGLERRSVLQLVLGYRETELVVVRAAARDRLEGRGVECDVLLADAK